MARSSLPPAPPAVLVLALVAGFYVLAFGVVAMLLILPVVELVFLHIFDFTISFACLAAAAVILWAIFPRPDHFTPPGPRIDEAGQPLLFAVLRDVARAAGQRLPAEVYLVAGADAWVAHRGGIMGLGSRWVMGIGLALLQSLTVPELRAVLAHEFGHYSAEDTRFGPMVYRVRSSIERMLQWLTELNSGLEQPFIWYGRIVLRVTHAVSRHQEALADQLAARIAGSRPVVSSLRAIHAAALAFEPYWHHEVVPALMAGFRPPLVEGFRRFAAAPSVASAVAEAMAKEAKDPKPNPYNTHPPLQDRIAAVEGLPPGRDPTRAVLAIALVQDVPRLEEALVRALAPGPEPPELKPLPWEEVPSQVLVPMWQSLARKHSWTLNGVTPAALPGLAKDGHFLRRVGMEARLRLRAEDWARYTGIAVGAALATGLVAQGWELQAGLAVTTSLRHGEVSVEPFNIFPRLASGELPAEQWLGICAGTGVGTLDLGKVAPTQDRP